jgi:hypothetical protein
MHWNWGPTTLGASASPELADDKAQPGKCEKDKVTSWATAMITSVDMTLFHAQGRADLETDGGALTALGGDIGEPSTAPVLCIQ